MSNTMLLYFPLIDKRRGHPGQPELDSIRTRERLRASHLQRRRLQQRLPAALVPRGSRQELLREAQAVVLQRAV